MGALLRRCRLCDGIPRWRVEREGDAVVTWACELHLGLVLDDLLPTDRHRDCATVHDLMNAWVAPG